MHSDAHNKKPALENGGTFTFLSNTSQGNDLCELIVKNDWLESGMPQFKAYWSNREERGLHPRAKARPCRSASTDPGCELYCSTCACRRTILCHSGPRCPRLTRRRPGWLGHLDSESPQRLIPSRREPPRHPSLTRRHFQTLDQDGASGTGAGTTSLTKRAWVFMLYLFVQESSLRIRLLMACSIDIYNAMKLR